MKQVFLALFLIVGLGSSFSFSQTKDPSDPFGNYLAELKTNRHEPEVVRFAGECGVDVNAVSPRYAQRPGDSWVLVKDLSKSLQDQETDFYGTVSVWHQADKILVERWGMELDTGDYFRMLVCLKNQEASFVESIDWSVPVDAGTAGPSWGYEQRWKIESGGKYQTTLRRFVDIRERPTPKPKLDRETESTLNSVPGVKTWKDMELPAALLR
jgi:hypothetical protein